MPYFDHFATTPVRLEVQEKISEITNNAIGNPSSVHASGRAAKSAIEEARSEIAEAIGAKSQEIIFTGGGTEANNLVLWSLLRNKNKHTVTTQVEHPAVLKVLEDLNDFGVTHTAFFPCHCAVTAGAWPAKGGQPLAIVGEGLYPIVPPVGDEDISLLVQADAPGQVEFTIPRADGAELAQELAVQ